MQWGHAHSSMESRLMASVTITIPKFQWGHTHASMERQRGQVRSLYGLPVSMGPRSFEHGKEMGMDLNKYGFTLQWGHAHTSMERGRHLVADHSIYPFQWGHAHTSMESQPQDGHRRTADVASMGPLSYKHGKYDAASGGTELDRLQWGHAHTSMERADSGSSATSRS